MWHGPPNIVVVVTEMKEGWVLRINSVSSFFTSPCCIFHIISIPFNCSDTAIRLAKTMIGAKVMCFVIFALFLEFRTRTRGPPRPFFISETGLKFLIFTQGEIGPRQSVSCEEALTWPTRRFVLRSLSKDDGDGNENGKKALGLDWQSNSFALASLFLYISLPSLHDYVRRESA